MLHKIIYKLGIFKRNPSLNAHYQFLKDTENWSFDELQNYQFLKCKELLEFAYSYSPYYKDLFDSVGFNPSEFKTLDDLKRIPICEKNDILVSNDKIHTHYSFKKKFFSETSGTSGQVLKFYRNEEWDSCNRAAMFRGYSWHGVNPWERNGYFWGYNINKNKIFKTRFLDFLQNRFRIFTYQENEIKKFARKLKKASYLQGYSSMIYEVAKIINKLGLSRQYHLKMVKGTSEKIYDNYHAEVIRAFGSKIISEYGAAETGLIAFECKEGYMHINMENVIVEDMDGEIVVTNLLSKSFPIIRYKLGDRVRFADPSFKCKCGRSHPIILDIVGRIGKNVIGKESNYPSLTFYYVFKNLALTKNINLNYQAIQSEKGKILIKIEQAIGDYHRDLQNELIKYFSNDIEFEIRYGQKLHTMDGKLKDFITELN